MYQLTIYTDQMQVKNRIQDRSVMRLKKIQQMKEKQGEQTILIKLIEGVKLK